MHGPALNTLWMFQEILKVFYSWTVFKRNQVKNCKSGSAQRGVYHEEIVFKTFSKRNQNVLHHNNSIDKRAIVMNFWTLTLIREFSSVGGLVIPWDHHIRSKTFLCLESTWKKLRKIYIANFFFPFGHFTHQTRMTS